MSFYIKRSEYWDYFWKQTDYKELFEARNEIGTREITLFNKYVNVINIETSAFCNRKCNYCPMSLIERKQDYMDDKLWEKILGELCAIQYKGHIELNLFNEPLLDVHLIDKMKEIKKKLPDVLIKFDSNGDYLKRNVLDDLIDVGLGAMIITRHAKEGRFGEGLKEEMEDYISKLGLQTYIEKTKYTEQRNITYILKYRDVEIIICANNWEIYGNDRGG